MHFTSVDLPAPFSPSSAWNDPAGTLIETSSSAVKAPKRMVMPMVSTPTAFLPVVSLILGSSRQLSDEGDRVRHRAEDAALHLDHLDRGQMIAVVGRPAAILQHHAFEAAVVGFAHGGVHAHIGGDAGEHDVFDAALIEDQLQVGGAERA